MDLSKEEEEEEEEEVEEEEEKKQQQLDFQDGRQGRKQEKYHT